MKFQIIDSQDRKMLRSESYNFSFDKNTGLFARWGKTHNDDPAYSPIGPEILDIEITSGGQCKGGCSFCYKSNGGDKPVDNMSFETFEKMFQKFPKTLTQIAFGIMNIDSNPDFNKMIYYSRKTEGVIPNYTCHGMDTTTEDAKYAKDFCGGIAVSIVDKEESYNSIHKYIQAGLKQVNIHYMISEETYDRAFTIIDDISNDKRLKGLNAIVFLQYKPKGRGTHHFNSLSSWDKFKKLTDYCDKHQVNYGFDSCSSPMVMKSMENNKNKNNIIQFVEPCESTLFSGYINWKAEFFPCSFVEGAPGWEKGIDILSCDDFINDVWNHKKVSRFRKDVIESSSACHGCEFSKNCRKCIVYKSITSCDCKEQ